MPPNNEVNEIDLEDDNEGGQVNPISEGSWLYKN